jgi:mRNA-degrading endonuclease RelE of RelBE toxin-antitoxin system
MAYEIVIEDIRIWRKDCNAIPSKDLQQIIRRIQSLSKEPWSDGLQVKKLTHPAIADFRLRWGHWRVLFNRDPEKKTVHLFRVLHRSKAY